MSVRPKFASSSLHVSLVVLLLFASLVALSHAGYVFNFNITINPTLTDSTITRRLVGPGYGDHRVSWNETLINSSSTFGLWLHLAGSLGQPRFTTYTLNAATMQGYHGISLAYQNPDSVRPFLSSSPLFSTFSSFLLFLFLLLAYFLNLSLISPPLFIFYKIRSKMFVSILQRARMRAAKSSRDAR